MGDFAYPNLLSGTRTGNGWTRTGGTGGNGFDRGTGIELFNSKSSECYLKSTNVVLHTGRTYTLSFYAASTANMRGSDLYVLDNGGSVDGHKWIAANKQAINLPAGGGMDHMDILPRPECSGRRDVPSALRQQRHDGRKHLVGLVPRHHAVRIGRSACLGTRAGR